MAIVTCEICGKGVRTTANNYIFKNGIHQHKKCPSQVKLNDEEKKLKRKLTDSIAWVLEKQKKPKLSPAQWGMVTAQIKKMQEQGYSLEDQLYAFRWYFDPSKDNEYKGYGIIGYVIEEALQERQDEVTKEEINANKGQNEEDMMAIMEKRRKERLGL